VHWESEDPGRVWLGHLSYLVLPAIAACWIVYYAVNSGPLKAVAFALFFSPLFAFSLWAYFSSTPARAVAIDAEARTLTVFAGRRTVSIPLDSAVPVRLFWGYLALGRRGFVRRRYWLTLHGRQLTDFARACSGVGLWADSKEAIRGLDGDSER
jgi:hypothetical protein